MAPLVEGYDRFDHGFDVPADYDAVFSTPVVTTSLLWRGLPNTLVLANAGANLGVRKNFLSTHPGIAWTAFPLRVSSKPPTDLVKVCNFSMDTTGILFNLWLASTGIYLDVSGTSPDSGDEFPIDNNRWYWIELIADARSGSFTMYGRVNGENMVNATASGTAGTFEFVQLVTLSGDVSGNTVYYGGNWVWGRPAGTTDFLGIPRGTYEETVLSDGPEVYWKLDGDQEEALIDSSGQNRHLVWPSSTDQYAPPRPSLIANDPGGNSREFGPNYRTPELTNSTPIKFTGTSSFSLELWYEPKFTNTDFLYTCGWSDMGGGTSDINGYAIIVRRTSGVTFTRKVAGVFIDPGYNIPASGEHGRHHVVGVYDGANQYLYIDGSLVDQIADTNSMGAYLGIFRVGTSQFGGNRINGMVDEVAIYAYNLNSTRIAAHYAAGSSPYGVPTNMMPMNRRG